MRRTSMLFPLLSVLLLAGIGGQSAHGAAKSRALSLRVLQRGLRSAAASGERPRELMEMAGITRVTGYLVHEASRDLILVGQVEPEAPALHAEDLAVALRNAWLRYATRRGQTRVYADPGCSIDPDANAIRRLSRIGEPGAAGSSEPIEEQMDLWCAVCAEPQQVRVMGVPFHSRFAKVMVEADYLMKRAVDGSLDLDIPGFTSLSDMRLEAARAELASGTHSPAGRLSLNRFWFYPGEAGFKEEEGVVSIEECPVVLLTEEEHITRAGLSGLGRPDPMAQEFARDFSAHYADIAAREAIYLELEGLFRLVALAKLVRYQGVQADLDYLIERFPVPEVKVAASLPGISRVRRLEHRRPIPGGEEIARVWMPTCGGVTMDFTIGPQNFTRVQPQKRAGGARPGRISRKAAILKARPSPDALYWDIGDSAR